MNRTLSLPLHGEFLREHGPVLGGSLLLHGALLVLLVLNLNFLPQREPRPVTLAIQATVVDARALRERAAAAERREREARLAAERLRSQAAEEERAERERRAAEQRRVEERRIEEQRRVKAERETAARRDAEAKRQAEAERQARVKREAEARRQAAAERRRAQTQADLARELAAEEDLTAAADSGLLDQYAEVIRQKVERNWSRPASARPGIACVVLVKQIPGGDVVDVKVTECNGDAAVVRSIEAAVLRSSPLPPPPDPRLFDRSLRFEFRPGE